MDWIIAIIVGGIAGWLASLVMNRDASMGIIWNIIVGIIGAIIGKFVLGLIGMGSAGWIMWFIAAIVGAVILLGIVNLVQRGRVR